MQRLGRIIFNAITVLSLFECVATVVLWVRSYWVRDAPQFDRRGSRWELASHNGRLWLGDEPQKKRDKAYMKQVMQKYLDDDRAIRAQWMAVFEQHPPLWSAGNAELNRLVELRLRTMNENDVKVRRAIAKARIPPIKHSIAYAVPAAATALVPAAWLVWVTAPARKRRWRLSRGLCPVCSYDLRATPERCPECGAIPRKMKA